MEKVYIKIGEHVFKISSNPRLLTFFNGNFKLIRDVETRPNLTITINDGFGVPYMNFDVKITIKEDHITYKRADYLIEVDSVYQTARVSVHDELALKHALMNLYSSFIVFHNWGLLVHSSCALEKGQAHIFSGQSGAGKSTAAKLSAPRELLSDEATILKISETGITVFDSPFRSELGSNGFKGSRLLASIQLLHQAQQNSRVKLKRTDALLHLIDKVFYWPHDSDETSRIMGLLKLLVINVPVYNLYFQKNNTFWELIS